MIIHIHFQDGWSYKMKLYSQQLTEQLEEIYEHYSRANFVSAFLFRNTAAKTKVWHYWKTLNSVQNGGPFLPTLLLWLCLGTPNPLYISLGNLTSSWWDDRLSFLFLSKYPFIKPLRFGGCLLMVMRHLNTLTFSLNLYPPWIFQFPYTKMI